MCYLSLLDWQRKEFFFKLWKHIFEIQIKSTWDMPKWKFVASYNLLTNKKHVVLKWVHYIFPKYLWKVNVSHKSIKHFQSVQTISTTICLEWDVPAQERIPQISSGSKMPLWCWVYWKETAQQPLKILHRVAVLPSPSSANYK